MGLTECCLFRWMEMILWLHQLTQVDSDFCLVGHLGATSSLVEHLDLLLNDLPLIKALNKEERQKSAVPQNVFSVTEFRGEKIPCIERWNQFLFSSSRSLSVFTCAHSCRHLSSSYSICYQAFMLQMRWTSLWTSLACQNKNRSLGQTFEAKKNV